MIKSVFGAFAVAAFALMATPSAQAAPLLAAQPVTISPLAVPAVGAETFDGLVHQIGQRKRHYYRHQYRHKGFYVKRGIRYYNGHRGIRYARHGYRHHKGYWFPRNAFSIRVYVGPRHVVPRRHTRPQIIHVSSQHVAWCHGRYKTYRASDNTYAYKVGKRTYCRSPYSR